MLNLQDKFLFMILIFCGFVCFAEIKKPIELQLHFETEQKIDEKIQSYFWNDYDSSRLKKKLIRSDALFTDIYYFYDILMKTAISNEPETKDRIRIEESEQIFCLAFRRIDNLNFENDVLKINENKYAQYSYGRECIVFPNSDSEQKVFYLWNGTSCGYVPPFCSIFVNGKEFKILGSTEKIKICGLKDNPGRIKAFGGEENFSILSEIEFENFKKIKIQQARNIKYSFKNCGVGKNTPVFDCFISEGFFPAGRFSFSELQGKYFDSKVETKNVLGAEVLFITDSFMINEKLRPMFVTVSFEENGIERKLQKRIFE